MHLSIKEDRMEYREQAPTLFGRLLENSLFRLEAKGEVHIKVLPMKSQHGCPAEIANSWKGVHVDDETIVTPLVQV